jgi:DNA-binding NtrC family response regulator
MDMTSSRAGQEIAPRSVATTLSQRRPTVLIVDDELLIRHSLGRLLEHAGYDVVSVADPETAMKRIRRSVVDAVILDIRLAAGRSGLEVLEAISLDEEFAALPVIVFTGVYLLTPAEETLIHRHHAHLFYKPEVGPKLLQQLDKLTRRRADSGFGRNLTVSRDGWKRVGRTTPPGKKK